VNSDCHGYRETVAVPACFPVKGMGVPPFYQTHGNFPFPENQHAMDGGSVSL
jgi:hypothetical protein